MSDTIEIINHIHINIVPVAAEDDDLETLSLVEEMRADFLAEISSLQIYTIEQSKDQTRGGGVIILIAKKVFEKILSQKDLLIQMLKSSQPAIERFSKGKYVQAVDVTIGHNTIHIGNATEAQTDKLVALFEKATLGEMQHITPATTVEITAEISKVEPPVIAEKSVTDQNT